MPYHSTGDLPDSVRCHLPPHAQEIYVAAFNNAWHAHADEPDREAVVHRIAWAAVKRRYRNAGDAWVPVASPLRSAGVQEKIASSRRSRPAPSGR